MSLHVCRLLILKLALLSSCVAIYLFHEHSLHLFVGVFLRGSLSHILGGYTFIDLEEYSGDIANINKGYHVVVKSKALLVSLLVFRILKIEFCSCTYFNRLLRRWAKLL